MSESILNFSALHERLRAGDDEAYVILYREGLPILLTLFYLSLGLINDADALID